LLGYVLVDRNPLALVPFRVARFSQLTSRALDGAGGQQAFGHCRERHTLSDTTPTLGFRELTVANFLTADPASSVWALRDRRTGETRPMSAQDWAEGILTIDLGGNVPLELQRMFRVARGTLLYAFFFYPLYGVGMGLVFMLCDSALRIAADSAGAPSRVKDFKSRLDWLSQHRVISSEAAERWDSARHLRNAFVHEGTPLANLPSIAVNELETTALDIDSLFAVVPHL